MKAIEVKQLTKRFGTFTAVDHISFEVEPGEIFGFLGANGAGKTTAMRMLCGLSVPTSGEARVAGFDVYRESESIKRKSLRLLSPDLFTQLGRRYRNVFSKKNYRREFFVRKPEA